MFHKPYERVKYFGIWAEEGADRQAPFQRFRTALDIQNPDERYQAVSAAYNAISRAFDQ